MIGTHRGPRRDGDDEPEEDRAGEIPKALQVHALEDGRLVVLAVSVDVQGRSEVGAVDWDSAAARSIVERLLGEPDAGGGA